MCEEALSGIREFVDSCESQRMFSIPGFVQEATEFDIFLRQCSNRFPVEHGNAQEDIPDAWHTTRWGVSALRGRPRFDGSVDELSFWLEEGYNQIQIAGLYEVHRTTIARRMAALGLTKYTPTSDDTLATVIGSLKDGTYCFVVCGLTVAFTGIGQNWGRSMLRGYLNSRGIRVSEPRIRSALKFVDPLGSQERRWLVTQRRVYKVNSLTMLRS
jgi:hypothetical protein